MNPFRYIRDAMSAVIGAALATVVVVIAYEGVPIGPLRYIPGIHYVIPEGRVASVKREALAGYVLQSELDAERAKVAKAQRDLDSANKAAARYATLMQEAQARNADQIEADAKEGARYEEQLRQAGRRCELDQSDIDWLRK